MYAHQAFYKLLAEYSFKTVLDVGCGISATHAYVFHHAGKDVTAMDLKVPLGTPFKSIEANYMAYTLEKAYDCVWLSHVLEHQLNVQSFLEKVFSDLADGGVLAITVPPLKHEIVGGHVSLWNMGLLLYRLVLAGFDCRGAVGKVYDYNISIIVKKKRNHIHLNDLKFDSGDIGTLAEYFPKWHKWPEGFNGQIDNINWE